MRARVRLLGHPVHPMLVVFPLGLLLTSVVFDLIGGLDIPDATRGAAHIAGYWTLCAGVVGALAAAPFGFLDWRAIPRHTRARRIGALHGIGNGLVSSLFLVSLLLRTPGMAPDTPALAFALAGAALSLITAWLGGELVARLGIGVDEDAGVNAPHSGPPQT